ncbi:host attachment protein [Planctomicrobium sp. SH661]|uniref:host attachment protein n=1 Tax=Planctomicrobium sp. SH661 TaxID=3448124 RepID=UPI003F5C6B92
MSYRREARVSENTWILVADRAKAIIFQAIWPRLDHFEELQRMDNPDGAAHPEEVLTDRAGRFTSHGITSQSGQPQTDFRHRTAQDFAMEIVQRLEQGRTGNEFGRLMIVAPALMLGVLRDQLSAPLAKMVVLELRKELVDARMDEIKEHVDCALAEQNGAVLVNGRR